ncbi:response regulator [Sphingomonas flavescens]|uniref:response regulator n=1 Tax=Sphingomonas flavescens TaxID=3132797 RepID=UPI0028052E32|nr:response regulator [Sphingomonas limnosediminicola]
MTATGVVSRRETERPQDLGGDGARVLVVDDDERNLLAIQTVLEDIGEIVVARSGEEALRHLLKGEFAVILLDVYMPGLDGYETAQMIRSREQSKRIPIVFLSAVNKETEHLIRGYAMGAVDYVFKPVDPIVLRSKVAVFVDLFAKTKEIERKAQQEQALLDANLRANAELLRAEQDLRRAEQRQAAIIESLPIILYLEPLEYEPRCPNFVSGDLQSMTGFTFDDVRVNPKLWADRLHEDDRGRVIAALAERNRTGRFAVEYRWRCANGSYRHFHDQAVLLSDAHGRPTEFAGTLTDVTEQRTLESQLVQAQKMDAIGKLTGGIAHDFNNLLAAVLGGLGLLERRAGLAEEHLKILAMTKRTADQGADLVKRLLSFARRQQLEPRPIDAKTLVEGVDDLLSHTLGGRVQLHWNLSDDAWCAFADKTQLELALMNLIINARDAMPEGGIITISLEHRQSGGDDALNLSPGNYVVFAVEDTGIGIEPELLEQVMEPFFTTKDIGKGTGLGLSMVYGFAKQSSGAIHLTSEPGEGTRAELWIPRANAAPTPAAEGGAVKPLPEALSVLLVDDHAEVRLTTAAMLEDLGHKVIECGSGHEARKLLDNGTIDLLVSDYAMPQMSGISLIGDARRKDPTLKALIITGYAELDDIHDLPADVAVLSKPFNLAALSEAIAQATKSRPYSTD